MIMAFRDRWSGRYPISLDEIRNSAGVLFGELPPPAVLEALAVDPVEAVSPPAFDPAAYSLAEAAPIYEGGAWRQAWTITALPPRVIVVTPADLWRRTEGDEAERIEQAMAAQPAKLRNLFARASTYQSDDPLWPILMGAATQLFGAARAAVLLAPSTP